ncbi:MAG: M24 family metallopeptidase [Candidatus Thorarchaeota archaeon]
MGNSVETEKCQQATGLLKELDLDAWLVWVRETSQMADPVLELILGGDLVWQSALLFTKSGEKIAIVGNMDVDAIRSKGLFDAVIPYTKGIKDVLLRELDRISPRNIGINYSTSDVSADGLTLGMYKILQEYLHDTPHLDRLVSAEQLVQRLRGRKTKSEIDTIRQAVAITETIFDEIAPHLKPGLTEFQIYDMFHDAMRRRRVTSAWNDDHNPAVDAGPNKSFGHSGPTDNKTKAGHLLHFDFGVKWNGYCSDIQRMFFFGPKSEVPEEVSDAFSAVRDAIVAASEFIRPGRAGFEVDQVARDVVIERGYAEYQHALGHQVGRLAHDGGVLLGPLWERYGESPKGLVEAGNVFTLELYVTTSDYGQVSLEEDILVTDSGCEFLSHPQNELIFLE